MNENGYDNDQQYDGSLHDSYEEHLPDGMMERMQGWMRDKLEDAMATAEQEMKNRERYERVESPAYHSHRSPLLTIAAVVIGWGGAFFFIFIIHIYMLALLCFGIMLLIYGIGYATDENYSFRRFPDYSIVLVMGAIFVLVAAYRLIAEYIPLLPQPKSMELQVWGGSLFAILGAVMLILNIISSYCMKKVCTEPVSAVCVYLKIKKTYSSTNGKSSTYYSPVFEYQYKGNTYCAAESYNGSSSAALSVGSRYDLCLNPSDPTDFYRKRSKMIPLIGDMLFIVMGICCCIIF